METFSALLAICAGNSPVPGEFPTQRPVTRSFHVYFDLSPNKRLSKQLWGWWFETQSRPLWRHRNGCWSCHWPWLVALTYLPLVPHICVSELDQYWSRYWLVACSAPSHYLKHAGLLSIGLLWTNVSENWIGITPFPFKKMHLKLSSAKVVAILCRGRWVDDISFFWHNQNSTFITFPPWSSKSRWLTSPWGFQRRKITAIQADDIFIVVVVIIIVIAVVIVIDINIIVIVIVDFFSCYDDDDHRHHTL